jgi:hypothetical protein
MIVLHSKVLCLSLAVALLVFRAFESKLKRVGPIQRSETWVQFLEHLSSTYAAVVPFRTPYVRRPMIVSSCLKNKLGNSLKPHYTSLYKRSRFWNDGRPADPSKSI